MNADLHMPCVNDSTGLLGYKPGAFTFWHRDLPEVRVHHSGPGRPHVSAISAGVARSVRVQPRAWAAAAFAALLLCLALPASAAPSCKVNVQTCSPITCAFLPGVGPVTAGRIAAAHPADLVALDAVKGIGGAKLVAMLPWVSFEGETTCTAKQHAKKGGAK